MSWPLFKPAHGTGKLRRAPHAVHLASLSIAAGQDLENNKLQSEPGSCYRPIVETSQQLRISWSHIHNITIVSDNSS